ncbi:MAG: asparaginase [Alphaproteobacteria bacterium]
MRSTSSPVGAVNPVLVEVLRGGTLESRHRGAAVVVNAAGAVIAAWGDVERPVFPRSAAKPLQALALVESGAADHFALGVDEIALACASHSGTPRHTIAVDSWLRRIGLGPEDLECGAHEPSDPVSAHALTRAGQAAVAVHNNCSGKHAGFLTLARHLAVPTAGYIQPDHPVQVRVAATIGDLIGCDMTTLPCGVDGCGIPAFAWPLRALAHGLARLAAPGTGVRGEAARRLVQAMAAHPFLVGGPGRFDTEVMTAIPGLVVKGGAEGVETALLPDRGLGIAVKIDDGASRAAEVALAAVLHGLGVTGIAPWLDRPLLNVAGREVGRIRSAEA